MSKLRYGIVSVLVFGAMLIMNSDVIISQANTVPESGIIYVSDDKYYSYGASKELDTMVDMEKLRSVLEEGMYQCQESIDIAEFNIPYSSENANMLFDFIFKEMPLNFHIQQASYQHVNGKITKIFPSYMYSVSKYHDMLSEIEESKEQLLKGIKSNSHISDVEKALLIHDRLALLCEYEYGNASNMFDIYGALVNGKAVCEGYTQAYDYLLKEVGIESYYCGSQELYHAWNIVFIDKIPYHVDVTWDDYAWDEYERGAVGVVGHDNFLRSSEGIYATGHRADDYETFPTDATYDDYVWQRSQTAFQLVNNELYYIDNEAQQLKCFGDNTVLCNVDDLWKGASNIHWGNNARLSSNNNELYYSLAKAIYKYDLLSQTSTVIFEPSLSGYNCIYGFQYVDNYLICDINNTAPCSGMGLENLYQIRELYDSGIPKSVITSIEILSHPNKTTYYKGDILNTAGLKLKVNYNDETYKTVTSGFTTSGFSSATSGRKTITVSYKGFNDTFIVTVRIPSVSLSASSKTLNIGNTSKITATTLPGNQSISWTSSNTKVATVVGGKITAKADGTATITAKFSYRGVEYKSTCRVTVTHTHSYVSELAAKATLKMDGSIVKKCSICNKVASTTAIKYPKTFALSTKSYTYNGTVRKPTVTVKDSAGKTISSSNYTVTYAGGRKNVGTYSVTITMKGNYSGTKTLSFKINPISITKCSVKLSVTSYTYDGKVKAPSVVVKNESGTKLTKNTHYTVAYASGRKNAGTYGVVVKMKGNYSGTKTLSFKINPISITKCSVKLSATSYTYDGKVKAPSVVVKNESGTTLAKNTHYTVSYGSGRKSVGTYNVTVKMKGNYSGTKTLSFKIVPPKTTLSKLTAGKKSVTVNITKKSSQVTGYQVQYSTSKKFTSVVTKTISSYATTKYALKNLSANKTYYVRVRTYKKVNSTTYYSSWSTYKYIKTK